MITELAKKTKIDLFYDILSGNNACIKFWLLCSDVTLCYFCGNIGIDNLSLFIDVLGANGHNNPEWLGKFCWIFVFGLSAFFNTFGVGFILFENIFKKKMLWMHLLFSILGRTTPLVLIYFIMETIFSGIGGSILRICIWSSPLALICAIINYRKFRLSAAMRQVGGRNFLLLCAARLFLLFSAVFFLLDAYNPNNLIGHIRNEFSRGINNIKANNNSKTLFYATIRLDDFVNDAESNHDIDAYMDSLMLKKIVPFVKATIWGKPAVDITTGHYGCHGAA
jgi:hypothetical protein